MAWGDELDSVQLFVPSLGQYKDVKYKAVLGSGETPHGRCWSRDFFGYPT